MAGLSRAALGAGTAVTFRKQQIFLDVKKWPLRQKTRANNCIHKVQQHLNLPLWLVLIVTKYNRGQYLASKFRPSLNFGVSPPSHHSTTPLGRWCCCDCWWRNVRESRQKLRKSPNKICENSPPIYDMYLGIHIILWVVTRFLVVTNQRLVVYYERIWYNSYQRCSYSFFHFSSNLGFIVVCRY